MFLGLKVLHTHCTVTVQRNHKQRFYINSFVVCFWSKSQVRQNPNPTCTLELNGLVQEDLTANPKLQVWKSEVCLPSFLHLCRTCYRKATRLYIEEQRWTTPAQWSSWMHAESCVHFKARTEVKGLLMKYYSLPMLPSIESLFTRAIASSVWLFAWPWDECWRNRRGSRTLSNCVFILRVFLPQEEPAVQRTRTNSTHSFSSDLLHFSTRLKGAQWADMATDHLPRAPIQSLCKLQCKRTDGKLARGINGNYAHAINNWLVIFVRCDHVGKIAKAYPGHLLRGEGFNLQIKSLFKCTYQRHTKKAYSIQNVQMCPCFPEEERITEKNNKGKQ